LPSRTSIPSGRRRYRSRRSTGVDDSTTIRAPTLVALERALLVELDVDLQARRRREREACGEREQERRGQRDELRAREDECGEQTGS